MDKDLYVKTNTARELGNTVPVSYPLKLTFGNDEFVDLMYRQSADLTRNEVLNILISKGIESMQKTDTELAIEDEKPDIYTEDRTEASSLQFRRWFKMD